MDAFSHPYNLPSPSFVEDVNKLTSDLFYIYIYKTYQKSLLKAGINRANYLSLLMQALAKLYIYLYIYKQSRFYLFYLIFVW